MPVVNLKNADIVELAYRCAERVANQLARDDADAYIYGVPRGGVPAAYAVVSAYNRICPRAATIVDNPKEATAFVDDIIDSGATRARYAAEHRGIYFDALITQPASLGERAWYVFPWESSELTSAEDIVVRLLQFIGEDPSREGLRETPRRFLAAWREYTRGYNMKAEEVLKTFGDGADGVDELVVVRDIPVYSMCEHHGAPFFGRAHIGYIPNGRILGLSKFARVVEVFARRLQVQERLTKQIADSITEALRPRGVAVVLECRHMCMESRGVRSQGALTTTSSMAGVLRTDASARAEFLRLVHAPRSVAV